MTTNEGKPEARPPPQHPSYSAWGCHRHKTLELVSAVGKPSRTRGYHDDVSPLDARRHTQHAFLQALAEVPGFWGLKYFFPRCLGKGSKEPLKRL